MAPRALFATAMATGLLAGGALVYLFGAGGGNGFLAQAAEPVEIAPGIVETAECALSDEDFETIETATVGDVAAMLPMERPISLAGLAFDDPNGEPTTMGDLPGVKLLNLWATWCAPCRAEMPHLDELQASEGEAGAFEVVALNVDVGDPGKPLDFLAEIGIEHMAHYRDDTLGTFNALREAGLAQGLPVTVLVAGDGCTLAAMNGPANWASPDAVALIDAARSL